MVVLTALKGYDSRREYASFSSIATSGLPERDGNVMRIGVIRKDKGDESGSTVIQTLRVRYRLSPGIRMGASLKWMDAKGGRRVGGRGGLPRGRHPARLADGSGRGTGRSLLQTFGTHRSQGGPARMRSEGEFGWNGRCADVRRHRGGWVHVDSASVGDFRESFGGRWRWWGRVRQWR